MHDKANNNELIGIGLFSLSLMLWELLLVRVFSVLLTYYFAFVVISLAMLGMAFGSAVIAGSRDPTSQSSLKLARDAERTSLGMVGAIACIVGLSRMGSALSFNHRMILNFLISMVPFVFAGKYMCRAIVRSPRPFHVYSAGMLGTALACVISPLTLSILGGPAAICFAALPAALAAFVIYQNYSFVRKILPIGASVISLGLFVANPGKNFQLHSGAGYPNIIPQLEKWNAFSRIAVLRFPFTYNWGLSPLVKDKVKLAEQLQIEVDCGSMTPLTKFNGDLSSLSYLKNDITGFANYLRPNTDVLVIGHGGGRDILSALVFQQASIHAVDINPLMGQVLNGYFGDFTGHLDQFSNIHFFVAEGRNFIERSKDRYGIIQLTLIDTWSASAAGAYAFVENGLYTVESWKSLLSHLNSNGILSVTRWYYSAEHWPVHILRACVLGLTSLRELGVSHPEKCILVLRIPRLNSEESFAGTVLISRSEFSDSDISLMEEKCRDAGCEVAYSWRQPLDPNLMLLMQPNNTADFIAAAPMDISPTTDDRPYFQFHDRFVRGLGSIDKRPVIITQGALILKSLLLWMTGAVVVILVSTTFYCRKVISFQSKSLGLVAFYFVGIGIAYIFVELALIQRFSIFLGHPQLGFTVILFSLLMATSAGSFYAKNVQPGAKWAFLCCLSQFLYLAFGPAVLSTLSSAMTVVRIFATIITIAPLGFFMGFYLPWGLSILEDDSNLKSLCWTYNAGASVIASVFGITCLIVLGEKFTLSVALFFYALSGFLIISRRLRKPLGPENR